MLDKATGMRYIRRWSALALLAWSVWNREQARRAKLAQMDQEVVPQAPTLKSDPAENPQQTDKDVQMDNMTKACAEMMKQPA